MLTMRLSEFILLNEQEKKLTVLHRGVLLAKRSSFESMVFLFQLGSYYVEAYCNPANKAIEEYLMFDNIDFLSSYLDAIPLDNLLNWAYHRFFLNYPVLCNGIIFLVSPDRRCIFIMLIWVLHLYLLIYPASPTGFLFLYIVCFSHIFYFLIF